MPKMREMDRVSRPLLALLLGTVVFLALWMTALKPSSSGGGSGSAGVGGYTADINAARGAVKTADAASAAHGGETAPPVGRQVAARPSNPAARQNVVLRALVARKVIVLLFYNPSGADDRAVRAELAAVPAHRGRVVKLSVPLSELSRYSMVTDAVSVNESPTLVLIDRKRAASTVVGFADRFEIAQRVADALAS